LATAPIPNGSTPEGAFRKIDEVVGRVAITPIGLREPLTKSKLAAVGVGAGLSAVIPEGYRAMTVKVDDVVGVSGFVMPGSFVDVVAVITLEDQSSRGPVSKIVLQNIKVLASGPKIDQPQDERQPSPVTAVTLQVTPEQAEKLVLATNEGKLQLVMRTYGDQDDTNTRGANKNSLMTGETMATPPTPKAEQPKTTAPAAVVRPRERAYVPREERQPVAAAPPAPPPPPRRNTVEMLEGAKKSKIELP
jgi:pilus assembly protein CpaB